mmetsp:Transcript_51843/g.105542  ORF Transcript_51843/g.105542 Transcript_51843/m.105542 type:complete len:83 (-) Transcript_51843:14-262(-)
MPYIAQIERGFAEFSESPQGQKSLDAGGAGAAREQFGDMAVKLCFLANRSKHSDAFAHGIHQNQQLLHIDVQIIPCAPLSTE